MQDVLFESVLDSFVKQCRVANSIAEDTDVSFPPTQPEIKELIAYLRGKNLDPKIVGSVGILHHMKGADIKKKFRPTVDVDLFVNREPGNPPSGWRQDPEAVGVASWISPSGGHVDFMSPGHTFPGGEKFPRAVQTHEPTASSDYPVAHSNELIKLKLNSFRAKDLSDIMALVRHLGHVPTEAELGKLTQTQRDNLGLVRQWYELQPESDYE